MELEKKICPAHNPETDAAVGLGGFLDFVDGISGDVDAVVEKADGEAGGLFELGPVESGSWGVLVA